MSEVVTLSASQRRSLSIETGRPTLDDFRGELTASVEMARDRLPLTG